MRDAIEIKQQLEHHAEKISEEQGGAPVVIIVAGSQDAGVPRCITAWSNLCEEREGRLRDLLGILQTAIQIETRSHFLE